MNNDFKRGDIIVQTASSGYHKRGDVGIVSVVYNFVEGVCLDIRYEGDPDIWAVNAKSFRKIDINSLIAYNNC